MKPLKFSFLFYATALILGILLKNTIGTTMVLVLALITLVIIGFSVFGRSNFWQYSVKNSYFFGIIFYLLCFSLGVGSSKYYEWINFQGNYLSVSIQKKEAVIQFTILQKEKTKKNKTTYIVDVYKIDSIQCKGKSMVTLSDSLIRPGDQLLGIGKLIDFPSAQNLGQFDYAKYLQNKQIYQRLLLKDYEIVGKKSNLYFQILHFRSFLKDRIESNDHFTSNTKSFLSTLLLGDRTMMHEDIVASFQRQGIMHVLAISGLHIGIIYMFLSWITFWLPKRIRMLLIICFLWLFVFLSGFSPSVFRAVFMFSIIAIGKGIGNRQSTLEIIGQALFLSLLFCPVWLFDVGFQLSYMAVLGIVWLMPLFKRCYTSKPVINYVLGLIYVSLIAQISVLPLQVYYFNSFSLTFLLSNLMVIPLITILLVIGLFYLLVGWVFESLSSVLSFILNSIVDLMLYFVSVIDVFTDRTQIAIYPSKISLMLLIVTIISIGVIIYKPRVKHVYVLGILSLVWSFFFIVRNNKQDFLIASTYLEKPLLLTNFSNDLIVYSADSLGSNSIVKGYQKYFQQNEISLMPLQFLYRLEDRDDLLVLSEEMSLYEISQPISYILISNNCKINFDRLLAMHQPKQIIIGNKVSNWYKQQLIRSCKKNNIPFHDIRQKGYWSYNANKL